VTRADYAEYDYLIGMDGANIRNMLRIFGGDPEGKVARLLSYAGSERDISDPWYTGEFGTTYNDVLEGCTAFLRYLQQNGRIDT
jgi:protein-tyrosine phosphatase